MEGWEHKPLSEICDFQRGLTYAKSDEVDSPGHTVLRANNIDLTSHKLDFNELKFISDSVAVPASKVVRQGSLLVCTASGSKAHLGKVAFIDSDYGYAFGGFMGQLTPSKGVDGRYLFYSLISPGYKDFIEALSDGVNINNLKFDDLGRFSVPLPPLPEQRRIVSILDESFDAIATAKANTEKSLQNAREVFAQQLTAVLCGRHEDWDVATIGEVCTLKSGTTIPVEVERPSGDVPYVKVAEMTMPENADGITTSIRFVDRADLRPAWLIPAGAVIFPKRGGAILTNKKRRALVDMCADLNIMSVIPSHRLTSEFLYLFFLTVDMRKLGTGASIPQINNYDIAPLPISFPASTELQRELTSRLELIREEIESLASVYARKLTALDELKKSLLHQAFTGALTAKSTDKQLEAVA